MKEIFDQSKTGGKIAKKAWKLLNDQRFQKWFFSVSVFFESKKIECDELWEEQIFLVEASSIEEAREMAKKIGLENEISYENCDGVEVIWVFRRVGVVYEIGNVVEHGVEIFSRFLKKAEAISLLKPFDE